MALKTFFCERGDTKTATDDSPFVPVALAALAQRGWKTDFCGQTILNELRKLSPSPGF